MLSDDDYSFAWDLYNITIECLDDPVSLYDRYNRVILRMIESMDVFERSELIRLLVLQTERKIALDEPVLVQPSTIMHLQGEEIAESHQTGDVSSNQDRDLNVTVRYLDENPGTNVELHSLQDSSFYADHVVDANLDKFLRRPLRIASIDWAVGSSLNTILRPWDLYFNEATVKRKIDNYAYLSCNLHIKVLINASPFYYGAALVSYLPLPEFSQYGNQNGSVSPLLPVNTDPRTCANSQRPHFWIYPQTNQGGEMTLPFLYNRNWLRVNARSDFTDIGNITISSPTDLKNANAIVGTAMTISVYAWATNVRLAGPTIALALQGDEYGVISTPASNIASIANIFSEIPGIGPYAKATEMIASGVGKFAKLFGYTNVPNIRDVSAMKNLPFHSFASAEISQPIEKLTLDPKQELTIDTRVCGANGDDELALASLTQREAYVTLGSWQASMIPGDIILKGIVSPYVVTSDTVSSQPMIQTTPLALVSTLFKFWRGDIIYRFKFICSKFHRGRAILQWDPYADIITNNPNSNVVYTQIIDISEETDIEFRVPYMANLPFLLTPILKGSNFSDMARRYIADGGLPLFGYSPNVCNGRWTLRVLTQQSAPVASAEILVLCSVRAAENFEFAVPDEPPRNVSLFQLQGEELVDLKTQTTEDLTDEPAVSHPKRYLVNVGEQIVSLRQLLRRTCYIRLCKFPNITAADMIIYRAKFAPQPIYRGYDPNGINTAKGTITPASDYSFTYAHNTPYSTIAPCFIGYRGSHNWHLNYDNSNLYCDSMRIYRSNEILPKTLYASTEAIPTTSSLSEFASRGTLYSDAGATGSSLLNQKTQSGLSVVFPNYSRSRFMMCTPRTTVTGTSTDGSDTETICAEFSLKPQNVLDSNSTSVAFYHSIGADFNLVFFINTPTWFIVVDPPPA